VIRLLPHPRSLRLRAIVVVVLVALSPLVFVALTRVLGVGSSDDLVHSVREAAERSEFAVEGQPQERWEAALTAIARDHRARIRLLDEGGEVLLDVDYQEGIRAGRVDLALFQDMETVDRNLGPLAERPEVAEALEVGVSSDCRTTDGAEKLVCHAVRTVEVRGAGLVYVQDSAPRSIRSLYEERYVLARLTLFVLPLALGLALWLGWRLVRPLEDLRAQLLIRAREAAPGARLRLQRGDEFGDLATAFNVLMKRLEQRSKANEAFVADLAHEFKNPVASIRAVAESLESGPSDPDRAARLARVLDDSSRRLERLLDQFLALARAEAGLEDEERGELSLDDLARGLVEAHGGGVDGVDFHLDLEPGLRVVAVPHGIEAALRNLLDNAASFAADGNVWVAGRREDPWIRLSVADDGPGIPEEERGRVFDRFYTTRGGKRGTGLGLSLVRAVIEAHGGSVWVEDRPGGGAAFHLRLPTG